MSRIPAPLFTSDYLRAMEKALAKAKESLPDPIDPRLGDVLDDQALALIDGLQEFRSTLLALR